MQMDWNTQLQGIVTALGIGLMIGMVRERRHDPDVSKAGTRTHTLIAVLGAIGWHLNLWVFVALVLVTGAFAISGYIKTAQKDPGLTGEVTLLVTISLAALAQTESALAAGLGVLCAILLHAKRPLQRFSREIISEREIQDSLTLAAAALVIMPLLPTTALDPWDVLYPTTLWKIVVLVMAVGMLGHIAQRAAGAQWGLPMAGFFSGFVSSTATIASFGEKSKNQTNLLWPSAAAALLGNLASLTLFAGVIATASPELFRHSLDSILLAGLALMTIVALFIFRGWRDSRAISNDEQHHSFSIKNALILAGIIMVVSLISAWLQHTYGSTGALIAAVAVALAEIHASAASIAQLAASGDLSLDTARLGILAALTASAIAKTLVGLGTGGVRYGRLIALGQFAMVGGAALALQF